MVNVPLYISYGKVAQAQDSVRFAKQAVLRGGVLASDYLKLLQTVRKSVEWAYGQNNNDTTLEATANYLFWLSGKRNITTNSPTSPFLIIVHPASQSVNAGADVVFTVMAIGGVVPYSYQWYKNGVLMSGETNQTLELDNVDSTDQAAYTVVITDSSDVPQQLTSNIANLTVNAVITVFAVATDTDPFPLVSDPYTYTYNQVIADQANISWNLTNGDNNRYFVFKEPVSQPVKLFWDNVGNSGNNGPIPDQLMREPVILSGFRYYLTRQTYAYLNGTPTALKTTA